MKPEDLALFERVLPGNSSLTNFKDVRISRDDYALLVAAAREEGRQSAGDRVKALEVALSSAADAVRSLALGTGLGVSEADEYVRGYRALLAPASPADPSRIVQGLEQAVADDITVRSYSMPKRDQKGGA